MAYVIPETACVIRETQGRSPAGTTYSLRDGDQHGPALGAGRSEPPATLLMGEVATGAYGHCMAALLVAACTPSDPGVLSREIWSVISNSPKPDPSRSHQRWTGHKLWEYAGDSRMAASADTVARDLVGPHRCPAERKRPDAEGTLCCHFLI